MDIEKINQIIKSTHDEFMETAGSAPYKVSADHQLLVADVSAKLLLIIKFLITNGVVDSYENTNKRGYQTFTLIKNGLDFEVAIFTDGTVINMRAGGPRIEYGVLESFMLTFRPSAKEGYDWDKITLELVAFIHQAMYRRQDAAAVNFDFIMREED